jgi:carbonic anhydrase
MRKVFHFESPREKYHCDAAVVWCFDNRFELGFRKFLKRIGVLNSDPIKVAGGAKCLASPEQESEREFVLGQIRKSIDLHGTGRVILMLHSDCGAFGGLRAFDNDPRAEVERLSHEMAMAAATLRAAIPGIRVEGYFVDFDGVWEVDLPVSKAALGQPEFASTLGSALKVH